MSKIADELSQSRKDLNRVIRMYEKLRQEHEDGTCAGCSDLEGELAAERARADAAEAEVTRLKSLESEVAALKAEYAEKEAACAAMRSAAQPIVDEMHKIDDWHLGNETDRVYPWYEIEPLAKALESNAGQTLLDRMKRMEEALRMSRGTVVAYGASGIVGMIRNAMLAEIDAALAEKGTGA